jgi:hypothetical protein
VTQIRARKPTGAVPYPLILVEGEEKAGKSWAAALLSKSPRVGATYWIDLGEGGADEYGAIPGARYLVVEHDGTYAQILDQVLAVKEEAARAKAAGEPPVVLVIDCWSDFWDGLKDWASERARDRQKRKGRSVAPDAEVQVTTDLWNDAGTRYRRAMTQLMTFPGIVVLTARGKEVVEIKDGKPVEGARVWKVEGHKSLAFDAVLWLRMFRSQKPLVVGARSVHAGIKPGSDEPQPIEAEHDNLLDWLIFDVLKVDPLAASPRDLVHTTGGELTEDEQVAEQPAQSRQQQRPAPGAAAPATARALALSAAKAATRAGTVAELEEIRKTAPAACTPLDVSSVITPAQRAAAAAHDERLAKAKDHIPFFGWLEACAACITKGGTSVRDASIYDEPEGAEGQQELVGATP